MVLLVGVVLEWAWLECGQDTMFVNCPQGNVERAGAYYLLRKENFKNSYPALNGDDFNTLFTHPIDGTIFLCRGRDATLHKAVWNEKTQMWDRSRLPRWDQAAGFNVLLFIQVETLLI